MYFIEHPRRPPCPVSLHAGHRWVMKKGCQGMLQEQLKGLAWSCSLQWRTENTPKNLSTEQSVSLKGEQRCTWTGVDVHDAGLTLHIFTKSWFNP